MLATINFFIMNSLETTAGFNIGRIALAAWGGWFIVRKTDSSLWLAALIGVAVLIVDHLILKGGSFIITQIFSPESFQLTDADIAQLNDTDKAHLTIVGEENFKYAGFLAFGGVVLSFAMFAPFMAGISFLGGYFARKKNIANKSGSGEL